jgi:quinol monooxygenase YgiN
MRRRWLHPILRLCSTKQEIDVHPNPTNEKLAFTAMWQVRDGEAHAAVDIIWRFAPVARQEPGLKVLAVNRNASDPARFLFYEMFTDAAAFAAYRAPPHFKDTILGEAMPKLSKRERVEYRPL